MQYKTIMLELIQDRPELYERLRSSKRLLPAIDAYSMELKASHQAWKKAIASRRPESSPVQVASEALEMAIEELTNRLPSASAVEEAESFCLDEAMNYLKRVTPPA